MASFFSAGIAEFRVNGWVYGLQSKPSVESLENGKFVVLWQHTIQYSLLGSTNTTIRGWLYNNTQFMFAPVLTKRELCIHKNQTIKLSSENIAATDISVDDLDIIFTVENVQHGHFAHIDYPTRNYDYVKFFTQAQIFNNKVLFVHDGSENTTSFDIAVNNGYFSTSFIPMKVIFNSTFLPSSTQSTHTSTQLPSQSSNSLYPTSSTTSSPTEVPSSVSVIPSGSESTLLTDTSSQPKVVGNMAAIIGGIVGGIGFIACLGGTIVLVALKRRSTNREDDNVVLDNVETGKDKKTPDASLPVIQKSKIKFESIIGKGGCGEVRKGRWKGAEVAIKQLPLIMAEFDPRIIEEFEREASLMNSFKHPNVVQLYGVCHDQDHYCIVMEYMARGSLDKILYDMTNELTWNPTRLQIVKDITYGLEYLHEQGVLHRDLKSGNVLVNESMRAKLTDFGVSKIVEDSTKTMTKGVGTVCWMAPEVMEGETGPRSKTHYTNKADVYSYAIILWELWTRQQPYEDVNQFQIPNKVGRGERPNMLIGMQK